MKEANSVGKEVRDISQVFDNDDTAVFFQCLLKVNKKTFPFFPAPDFMRSQYEKNEISRSFFQKKDQLC